jgi:hypothetical protein
VRCTCCVVFVSSQNRSSWKSFVPKYFVLFVCLLLLSQMRVGVGDKKRSSFWMADRQTHTYIREKEKAREEENWTVESCSIYIAASVGWARRDFSVVLLLKCAAVRLRSAAAAADTMSKTLPKLGSKR